MVDEFTHEDALTFASSTEDIWLSRETVPYSFPTINGSREISNSIYCMGQTADKEKNDSLDDQWNLRAVSQSACNSEEITYDNDGSPLIKLTPGKEAPRDVVSQHKAKGSKKELKKLIKQEDLIKFVVNALKESRSFRICVLQSMVSFDLRLESEYLMQDMLEQLKKKRENLENDQLTSFILSNGNHVSNAWIDQLLLASNRERKPDKDESESHNLLQTNLEKAQPETLFAHQWSKPSTGSRHSSSGAEKFCVQEWSKPSAGSCHSSSGVSTIPLRKDYQGSDNDVDDVASSQVMSAVISSFASGHLSKPIFISYDTLMQATKNFDEKKIDEGGSLIAAGSFGQVFLGEWQRQRVAVKRLKKPKNEHSSTLRLSKRQYMNEVSALTMCPPHPNVVRLIGICDDGPELCLVYEYVEGRTLAQHLAKESREPLSWNERIEMAHDIASSIHHIQSTSQRPLIHRDVKSSNILTSCDRRVRLANFGLSCFGEHLDNMHASFLESGSTTVGTRCYMPPEAFKGIFSTRTDVYSIGMVLFELLTGLPPYSSSMKLDLATFLKQIEGEGTELVAMSDPRAAWPDPVSNKLIDLAKRCTDIDSHRRPYITEVLKELRGITRMGRCSSRKVCETTTVTADTTDRESSSAFCGQSRDHQKGSEDLMLGQLKKKTRENLDHDQERKPDKDESESHSLLQTSVEKAAAKKLYAHQWINPSVWSRNSSSGAEKFCAQEWIKPSAQSRHSSSGVSSIQLKDYQGSGNDVDDVASSQTTLETVAAKSLSADQWTKSSAPSRHCSSGDSNRQWRKDYKGSDSDADNVSSSQVTSAVSSTHTSRHFPRLEVISYNDLKQATNDFNEWKIDKGGSLIAAGSFGQVFLGNWQDQRVAVKRLKKPKDERLSTVRLSKKQYPNEVLALTRCSFHPNVVRLLGISDDGPEMCLVYEYVDGMTLAQHLAKESSEPLSWNERLEMAHDIAKSIHHIQTTSQRPLIHRDVKSANILVSRDRRVILADFGLSCFGEHVDNMDASFCDSGSMSVGTHSYMSPEACKGIYSTRTDVYSFGVVLFELLTGRPSSFSSKKLDLVIWLKGMEREGVDLVSMCDPRAAWSDRVARLLFDLAKRCTDFDCHRRPFIREVLRELDRVSRIVLEGILGMCLIADRLEEVIEGRGNKQ
ncbi:uncharacterized protein LOC134188100 isoform X2 [Corticium candelabrum]|uniref:uncharacterized protein LOC134188100 isoform X2 n=1 Tax=Corticium candelabrum TaxID=121492 RepID=UPI002E2630C3|nr:uncharacterized protein LOC134188100 isoform X2 [Corticium candelabrum]